MSKQSFSADTDTDIGAALNAGMALASAFQIAGLPAVLTPAGSTLKTFPELMDAPRRIMQAVQLSTLESFLSYLEEFTQLTTVLFCDITNGMFTAIIDYHGPGEPDWCVHTAQYTCPKTEEWKAWRAADKKHFTQEEFAEFIEANLADIRSPTGAEMLEIATTIAAKSEVTFRRAIRLDNGQIQLGYDTSITGQAGEYGQFSIPEKIKLGIRLFKDGEAYEIDARFRYRLNNGKITLWYELIRPDRINDDAVNNVFNAIKEAIGHTRIYQGNY